MPFLEFRSGVRQVNPPYIAMMMSGSQSSLEGGGLRNKVEQAGGCSNSQAYSNTPPASRHSPRGETVLR